MSYDFMDVHIANGDYIGEADGLLHCGVCREAKQAYLPEGMTLFGRPTRPRMCACARERMERDERRTHRERCAVARHECFEDIPGGVWRFDAAQDNPALDKVRTYAHKWERMKDNHIGLLLFGAVGTGKSFAAGCVANHIIEQGGTAKMTAFAQVVSKYQSTIGTERDKYLRSLMKPELLILDDLGAERNTPMGRECVFQVVNRRYLTGKPMIVTTNIEMGYMKNCTDMDERRVFDRLLEVCMPIRFDGVNFRRRNSAANMALAAELLRE